MTRRTPQKYYAWLQSRKEMRISSLHTYTPTHAYYTHTHTHTHSHTHTHTRYSSFNVENTQRSSIAIRTILRTQFHGIKYRLPVGTQSAPQPRVATCTGGTSPAVLPTARAPRAPAQAKTQQ